jgi:23S rRNA pseudouridine2605 synthase
MGIMSGKRKERLQKVMAHAGVASRRKSEELISQGRVTVNNQVVTQLGTKVDPDHDEIRVDGEVVTISRRWMYVMLNKPRGVLSTMTDDRGRRSLDDLITAPERLYPVGRLDAASEGLILLTDDGELANLLTHPRYMHEKEYVVLVNGHPTEETLAAWQRGVMLDGQRTAPARVTPIRAQGDSMLLRIVMREGRKRQIRRMAALLGHPARELKRTGLGPLRLGSLESGQWRYLTAEEVRMLNDLKRQHRPGPQRSRRGKGRRRRER